MSTKAVVVFTAKTAERILEEGGTSDWRLDPLHAASCDYVICTRNSFAKWSNGPEPHRSAFLVGRLAKVVRSINPKYSDRYLIRFSEYATVALPEVWRKGDRNPVTYGSMEELGIDPTTLEWKPMPGGQPAAVTGDDTQTPPFTIAEAKKRLAATFGVPTEAIEITIRA